MDPSAKSNYAAHARIAPATGPPTIKLLSAHKAEINDFSHRLKRSFLFDPISYIRLRQFYSCNICDDKSPTSNKEVVCSSILEPLENLFFSSLVVDLEESVAIEMASFFASLSLSLLLFLSSMDLSNSAVDKLWDKTAGTKSTNLMPGKVFSANIGSCQVSKRPGEGGRQCERRREKFRLELVPGTIEEERERQLSQTARGAHVSNGGDWNKFHSNVTSVLEKGKLCAFSSSLCVCVRTHVSLYFQSFCLKTTGCGAINHKS